MSNELITIVRALRSKQPALTLKQTIILAAQITLHARKSLNLVHAVREQDDDIVKSLSSSEILSTTLVTMLATLAITPGLLSSLSLISLLLIGLSQISLDLKNTTTLLTPVSLSESLSKSHLSCGPHFISPMKGSNCVINKP